VSRLQEDTLVRHARREAAIALAMWAAAMIYTIAYCYTNGYGRTAESLTFVLWFPDWVFWGIVVPWAICAAASLVFAFGIMGDEPLGEETDADPLEIDAPREVQDG
jgi:fatty acid desaturase